MVTKDVGVSDVLQDVDLGGEHVEEPTGFEVVEVDDFDGNDLVWVIVFDVLVREWLPLQT